MRYTNNLAGTKDRAGHNQYGEPTSITDELGNVKMFKYDGNLNPANVTDGIGTLASFQFNGDGTMQSGVVGYDIVTQPSVAAHFAYDSAGNLSSTTDSLGRVVLYSYDSLGHKLSMVQPSPNSPAAQAVTRRVLARSRPRAELEGNGPTTTYQYDSVGNLVQTSEPLGRVTTWQYDANGNQLSITDARGYTTYYQYDSLDRVILITYPTQPVTTKAFTYDFRNNIVNETDQAGNVTNHQYDLAGRLTAVTRDYGTSSAATTGYSYDNAGRKETETDALGHVTTFTYDSAGNLVSVSGVAGDFQYGYDNAQNLVSVTDADNNTTAYLYDARRRLVKVTYPDLTTKSFTYNGAGKVASVTDQAGTVIQYTYDPANELKTVVQTNSPDSPANTNSYGYDNDGNLISWIDANTHGSSANYDVLGEPTAKTLPDGSLSESATYDADGNLISLTHYNGKTTAYAYDGLDRLITRTPDPSLSEPAVSFTYTLAGSRATMTDGSGTTTYTYDGMNRLITKATPEGTLSYTYDGAGDFESVSSSHSNGISLTYTYDDLNRLSTVVDHRLAGQNTTTFTYDPASNVVTATYPNGVQSTVAYDQLNRISGLTSQVSGYQYQRDPVGNRTSATEQNGRSVNWSYDNIDRLTQEAISSAPSGKNGTVSYGLDPVGNRQSITSSLAGVSTGSFTFNADDLLSTESYDLNGNALSSSGKSFGYDSENHLTSMSGGVVTLLYDGDGNRVAKTVNGVTTQFLVDTLNPTGFPQVVEEVVGGSVTRQYTYGLERISEDQIISSAWTPSFYGYDGMGSVRQLTNSSGGVTDSYEYDAFGNPFTTSGSTPNNYLYRGEQYDPDLSLYYLRARYYNPQSGRFLSQDPFPGYAVSPTTLHRYAYVGANPANWVDPTGLDEEEEGEIQLEESEAAVEGEEAAAKEISCIFDTGGSLLDVLFASNELEGMISLGTLAINAAECAASGTEKGGSPPKKGCCFAAGTPVHTDHGDVPVEQIEVGDEVVARNSKTGKLEQEPVTALIEPHHDKLIEIRVEGELTPIRPSTSHPFWVRRGDAAAGVWVEAGKLRMGDLLETKQGDWRMVTAIRTLPSQEIVYNFTVAKDHDYFVGETGFLVHNIGGCGCKFPDNPGDMDDLMGFPGEQVPDLPNTPGRNKWIWNLTGDGSTQLRFEAHPYFPPGLDPGEYVPHWQLKYPGAPKPHQRWFPGEDIPGCK